MPIRFVHLTGTHALLAARMLARADHFMPATLLDSQLATLEPLQPDESSVALNVEQPPRQLLEAALQWLLEVPPARASPNTNHNPASRSSA